jgi:polyisoprenoid-binding protein YceI
MLNRTLALALLCAAPLAPATAATYKIDPMHTYPSFEFPHMGISVWRGKFDKTSGTVEYDAKARTGKVDIKIDPASVDFGLDEMEEHARGENWFDVEKYPDASYTGTLKFKGGQPVAVDGQFTFRGQTKPLKLKLTSFKCIEHPYYKKEACGADATGELNWSEWGMAKSEYGKGDMGRVTLRIQVEALKQD